MVCGARKARLSAASLRKPPFTLTDKKTANFTVKWIGADGEPHYTRRGEIIQSRALEISQSLAYGFDDQFFGPLAVEFRIKNLLPGAEVKPAFGNRQNHLVVDQ